MNLARRTGQADPARRRQIDSYVQIRGEAFNLLNHNNLAAPNTTISSSDFGKILTRSGSRIIQLGLRLVF